MWLIGLMALSTLVLLIAYRRITMSPTAEKICTSGIRIAVPIVISIVIIVVGQGLYGWVKPPKDRPAEESGKGRGPQDLQPTGRTNYALVIGIGRYTAGWTRLPGVAKDVAAVKKALEEHGFYVESVMDPDAAYLQQSLEDFIKKHGDQKNHRLLFYIAGHGYSEPSPYGGPDLGYIVPADAPMPQRDPSGFRQLALSMQRIEEYALKIHAGQALFLFDSCFSGALFALTDPRRTIPRSIVTEASRPVRQFITSGSANERVPDKSIFREQFLAALSGAADRNGDGGVTGTELGAFFQEHIPKLSGNAQHPQYGTIRYAFLSQGDFVFAVLPGAGPAVAGTPARPNLHGDVVVGIPIGGRLLNVRESDIRRIVERSRPLVTPVGGQPTKAQVKELAKMIGLLDSPRINPHLRFLDGDISYWYEQELRLDELRMHFAARKAVLDAADRDGVVIADQGVLSWAAGPVMANEQFRAKVGPSPIDPPPGTSLVIYADAPQPGWENWSWDCRCNLRSTDHARNGKQSIRAELLRRFGGLKLANRDGVHTKGYNRLEFFIHGGDVGGQRLKVYVHDSIDNGIKNPVTIGSPYIDNGSISPNEWKLVSIPLEDLDALNTTIFGISISDISGMNLKTFYIDDIMLVSKDTPVLKDAKKPINQTPRIRITMSSFKSGSHIEWKVEGIAPKEYKDYKVLVYVLTNK